MSEVTNCRIGGAISVMKAEIKKLQQAQAHCLGRYGIIKSHKKYEYNIITQAIKSFYESIKWLEKYTDCK